MRSEFVIVALIVLALAGYEAGFYVGNGSQKTVTTTSAVTEITTVTGPQSVTVITAPTTEDATVQCPSFTGSSKLFVKSAFLNGTAISGLAVVISDWESNCSGVTPTSFSLINGQLYIVSMQGQYANCILSEWQGPTTGNSGYYERPIAINQTTTLVAAYDCA